MRGAPPPLRPPVPTAKASSSSPRPAATTPTPRPTAAANVRSAAPKKAAKDSSRVESIFDQLESVAPLPAPPSVRLPNDKLVCACGDNSCETYDSPKTSYVLTGFDSPESVQVTLEKITERHGSPGDLPEAIIAGEDMDLDELQAAVRRAFGVGYRGEALERASLIYSSQNILAEELKSAMMRLAAGTDIQLVSATKDTGHELIRSEASPRTAALEMAQHPDYEAEFPFKVSFIIQYFNRTGLVRAISSAIADWGLDAEVLIHDDSRSEHREWREGLGATRHILVHSGNLHEIRGYNRLVRMASAEYIVLLQDDDIPPPVPQFLDQGAELFQTLPRLALIGGMTGQIQGGPNSGRFGKPRGNHVKMIPIKDAKGRPFMFVSWVNMGPFLLRRSVFLHAGAFIPSFSCRGDPGIGFDYEYGIRLWKLGFQTGLTMMNFKMHAGGSRSGGTRSSSGRKQRRDMIEARNTRAINTIYKGFYINHTPEGANKPTSKGYRLPLRQICPAARLPSSANAQRWPRVGDMKLPTRNTQDADPGLERLDETEASNGTGMGTR
ncbi:hypothetical protein CYMTET_56316 [Cymbomonas tetramitiformis]|uniref:Glycosyltransferase 2-like domain-containing protein n=1 Tax=Cymbomonas tetramitiformis TaxID=36881 RepID=A0AAE0BCE5_9CHLO|nr:hypothetical protein CYMTET_56316 [Cymbomonas tetramitiformis]